MLTVGYKGLFSGFCINKVDVVVVVDVRIFASCVTTLHCQVFRRYWTCIRNYPSFRAVINVLVNCERKLLLYTGHVMEVRDNEEIVL